MMGGVIGVETANVKKKKKKKRDRLVVHDFTKGRN